MTAPVIDGYTDLVEIGRGGFGVVYRATEPAFERTVAIKVIVGAKADDATLARFERECRAAGALSGHPNIVRVYGAGRTADGMPYLVMDYLSGGSVSDKAPYSAKDTIALGVAVAGALETAHRSGIIHRDLKPENILYSGFGAPQLVDFGIARMRSAYETRSGTISATLTYAAPEVISGSPATPASDVYSLACVLHFMLTGSPPFWRPDEESLAPLLARIATAPPPPLPDAPPALASLIASGLAKTPDGRPSSAADFGFALQQIARSLGEDPPTVPIPLAVVEAASSVVDGAQPTMAQAERAGLVEPAAAGRSWRTPALAAAAVVALVGGATAVVVSLQGSPATTPAALSNGTPSPVATSPAPSRRPVAPASAPPKAEGTTTGSGVISGGSSTGSGSGGSGTGGSGTGGGVTGAVVPTRTATTSPPARPTVSRATVPTSFRVVETSALSSTTQSVRLAWSAPSSSGGESPSYKITCQVIVGGAVYTGVNQGSCNKGSHVYVSAAGSLETELSVGDGYLPGNSWVRWRIAAHNSAGDSGLAFARTTVPDVTGLDSSKAYAVARVASLNAGGAVGSCSGSADTICQQSVAAGSSRPAGAAITLYEPKPTPSPTP